MDSNFFEPFPILESRRLFLREIQPGDAGQIFEMRSNGRINEFIARPKMNALKEAIFLVDKTINAYENKQAIGWAGITKDGNEFIGTCGFNSIDFDNNRAEIGGELALKFWGMRMAIEAVECIVRFGFEIMGLHSIEAKISPENRGAIFLAENLGFEREALYKDRIYFNHQYRDLAVYSLINKSIK